MVIFPPHMLEINPGTFTLLHIKVVGCQQNVALRENDWRCSFHGFLPASSWISSNHTAREVSREPHERKKPFIRYLKERKMLSVLQFC